MSSSDFEISTIRGIVYNNQDNCIYFTQGHRILKFDENDKKIVILFESKNADNSAEGLYDFFGADLTESGRKLVVVNTKKATIEEFDLKTLTLKVLFQITDDTDPLYSAIAADVKVVGNSAYVTYPFEKKIVFLKDLLLGDGSTVTVKLIEGDFDFPFGIDVVENVIYIADGKTAKLYDISKDKIIGICDGFSSATGIVAYFDENEKVTRVFVFDREDERISSFSHNSSVTKASNISKVVKLASLGSSEESTTSFLIGKKIDKEIISKKTTRNNKSSPPVGFIKHNFNLFVPIGTTFHILDRNALVPVKSLDLTTNSVTVATPPRPSPPSTKSTSTSSSKTPKVTNQQDHIQIFEREDYGVTTSDENSKRIRSVLFWVSIFFIIFISFILIYYYLIR